jgi:uncharacterized membrane protein YadS
VAKLLRNLSLGLLIPLAGWWGRREAEVDGEETVGKRPALVPFFVVGFLLCLVLRTVGNAVWGSEPGVWESLVRAGETGSDVLLVCGMTALGLSVSFGDMWRIGWRPLVSGLVVAVLVGLCSLGLNVTELHFGL